MKFKTLQVNTSKVDNLGVGIVTFINDRNFKPVSVAFIGKKDKHTFMTQNELQEDLINSGALEEELRNNHIEKITDIVQPIMMSYIVEETHNDFFFDPTRVALENHNPNFVNTTTRFFSTDDPRFCLCNFLNEDDEKREIINRKKEIYKQVTGDEKLVLFHEHALNSVDHFTYKTEYDYALNDYDIEVLRHIRNLTYESTHYFEY